MGDHATKVDPHDLHAAARAISRQADSFQDHVVGAFKKSMQPYSAERLDEIADERSRRIRGKDYDKSTAEDKTVASGATSDWLNPFGRFHDADRLMGRVDDARAAAIQDATEVLHELKRMAGALERAARFYEQNEDTNTDLTKKIMETYLATGASSDQA
ncbi:hypothetical protein Athai_25150 [Actinocatenispora thailandica]|uniref:Excreted virulence factor EspC (Type VII ESX diderm) n=1 Tax=Actinocatenispora thailandica TaxID=227318 RepID=A0A7R7DPA3_9ACTN|nr:hypothetical protein [Actinocatenispora thailandica]BCJ35012.1 hypothetical protein Athai_25150 [Actinocatenispora thailandica]